MSPARQKLPLYATESLENLQRLTANIVSPRCESQGVSRQGELFILLATVKGFRISIAFHIVHKLDEQAKHNKAVITTCGIITTLLYGLELQNLCTLTCKLYAGGRINLATCVNIELFEVIGGQVWLNHHSFHLFSLPNPENTTITDRANWSYDDVIDAEDDNVGDGGEHPFEGGPSEVQH